MCIRDRASTSTAKWCVLRRRRARTTEREGPRRRAPLPAAHARGRETASFAIRALVRRAACPRRRGGHGGPGVAETPFSRSRPTPSAAPARVPRNVCRVFPARASARALPCPPSRARATRRRGPRDASAAPARRNGTECDTPLSLARVSSFSLAQDGDTPLRRAAQCGHVAVAEMLIAAGAEVNLKDDVRRAAARSCRARALSLSPSLRARRRRSRAARVSRRAILSTSDV